MTTTAFDVFKPTIQKSSEWVDQISEVFSGDRRLAYAALRVVLHELRDRLPVAEAVHLGAQFPMLIRGLYYEGWRAQKPHKLNKAEFLRAVGAPFACSMTDPHAEVVARAVLDVVARHISAGEVEDVKSVLPKELRELLPDESRLE